MYTIVKEEITFTRKNNRIAVWENENFLTFIEDGIYMLLTMFNGKLDDTSIICLLAEVFSVTKEDGEYMFSILLDKFKYILSRRESIENARVYDNLVDHYEEVDFKRIRSIVPNMLVISLTQNCFMKCRYCYAGARYSMVPEEKYTLEMELIQKILVEAKALGINHIGITGGDPFVRQDIFDILDNFKKFGITTSISTKKLLSKEEIAKIASYDNIVDFQVSLDTDNDLIEEKLIGKKNYSTAMLKVIMNLLEYNIDVKVNSVITKYNLPSTIEFLYRLDEIGVNECSIGAYTANLGRNESTFYPELSEYQILFKKVDELKLRMKVNHPVLSFVIADKEYVYGKHDKLLCVAGLDGFIIGPTGNACICERFAYSKFTLGNLKDMSIMEIWNSEELRKYWKPDIEMFKGTKCYKCEEQEYCIKRRGICYVHSYILNRNIFAPDNLCKYDEGNCRIY